MSNYIDPTNPFGFEIDFLPVGNGERSGDAICMRWGYNLQSDHPDQFVMVVDGGFKTTGDDIISHLSQYYKTDIIHLLVNTHPDGDHIGGISVLLDELKVLNLWMHNPWSRDDLRTLWDDDRRSNKSIRRQLDEDLDQAKAVLDKVKEQRTSEPFPCGEIPVKDVKIRILGPSEEYYKSLLPDFLDDSTHDSERVKYLDGPSVPWTSDLFDDAGWTTAKNNSSAIICLDVKNYGVVLLTGDAGIPALNNACDYLESTAPTLLERLRLFQIPHHGSIQNLGPSVLKRLLWPSRNSQSRWACASVAGTEDIKHPSKHVLNALRENDVSCIMTAGKSICFSSGSVPERSGWVRCKSLDLYQAVENVSDPQQ